VALHDTGEATGGGVPEAELAAVAGLVAGPEGGAGAGWRLLFSRMKCLFIMGHHFHLSNQKILLGAHPGDQKAPPPRPRALGPALGPAVGTKMQYFFNWR
jgi:hypothetical protein